MKDLAAGGALRNAMRRSWAGRSFGRARILDASGGLNDNRRVSIAEVVVLLVIAAACYAALAPVRSRIERWWMRRGGRHRRATVIPLVRGGDGVYARGEKEGSHGGER